MSDPEVLLVPNVGGEEGPDVTLRHPAARNVARLWCLLFGRQARFADGVLDPVAWPSALGEKTDRPVYDWLGTGNAHAWLNTPEAAATAREAGHRLAGAEPTVVRAVHDKGFALEVCERESLLPRPLRGLIHAFDPEALAQPDVALTRIRDAIESWPDWTGGHFTLKPRIGGSGRGRVPGERARFDAEQVRAALPRLSERGGALLEPWLRRTRDWSVQLHVGEDGALTLLATLEQWVSASGIWRGHRGELGSKGRVFSGGDHDDALLEAAMEIAHAAQERGYHGPCGIDGFSFEGPDGELLRPVVELNARFTTGTVAAGLIRRCHRSVKKHLRVGPDERLPFRFAPDAPEAGWPGTDEEMIIVPLWSEGDALRPALAFSRDAERLTACVGF